MFSWGFRATAHRAHALRRHYVCRQNVNISLSDINKYQCKTR